MKVKTADFEDTIEIVQYLFDYRLNEKAKTNGSLARRLRARYWAAHQSHNPVMRFLAQGFDSLTKLAGYAVGWLFFFDRKMNTQKNGYLAVNVVPSLAFAAMFTILLGDLSVGLFIGAGLPPILAALSRYLLDHMPFFHRPLKRISSADTEYQSLKVFFSYIIASALSLFVPPLMAWLSAVTLHISALNAMISSDAREAESHLDILSGVIAGSVIADANAKSKNEAPSLIEMVEKDMREHRTLADMPLGNLYTCSREVPGYWSQSAKTYMLTGKVDLIEPESIKQKCKAT